MWSKVHDASELPAPAGSYRLRLCGTADERFGFAEAAAFAPYLMALGVSHVHLSPVLQPAAVARGPASAAVTVPVDGHVRLSEELGGLEAFRAMAARFRAHGLGVLVDVLPAPVSTSTPPSGVAARADDPEIFERPHGPLLGLVSEGLVDGLRIDDPDGLSDPRGYLERLAERLPGKWILLEKAAAGEERVPGDWPCAGTSGYDSLAMVNGLFVDREGEKPLADLRMSFTGGGAASLDDIGAGHAPGRFTVAPDAFHAHCARLVRDWPSTMTALSDHDTEHQEDVRARFAVLAEMPGPWADAVTRWQARCAVADGGTGGGTGGAGAGTGSPLEPDLDYLMWQTLVGAWPLTFDRLTAFLVRAARAAGTRTTAAVPDRAYEAGIAARARQVLDDRALMADVGAFVDLLEPYARINTLGQKIVQLTMPGVPDVYQGCELTGFAVAGPDNLRPVDHAWRRDRLLRLDSGRPPRGLDDEKLLVTSRALRQRREHPDWYGPPVEWDPAAAHSPAAEYEPVPDHGPPLVNDPATAYRPLPAAGPAAEHAVAFWRGNALTVATRLPVGLERLGGWKGTTLDLGYQGWRDVLTGALLWGPVLDLGDVLERLPVALLVPKEMRS
ncbi:hypothetical protein [Actinomadura xylanilytica]|uniref:hypothetical protein n=1 Tax=Actinomadura xylanilytica TaxID=887459 RepID=UPI00255AD4C6|nr:hypothetical protein [Actinomadura xylanilytica]MDL4776100.1 hypothetical protein [Actinomadura xylanilytica]